VDKARSTSDFLNRKERPIYSAISCEDSSASKIDTPLLAVRDVMVRFGGIVALDGVTFNVDRGSVVGLIGPNGAGKTTLFNCLSRLYTPNAGDIVFEGKSIIGLPSYRMSELGIGRTFQNIALFDSLSVLDNVRIGCHSRSRGNFVSDALRLPSSRRREISIDETSRELVTELELDAVVNRRVSDLSFGTRKRVELARALAARPKLLLLDEPACGLNHEEVKELGEAIRRVRRTHTLTVILVEHHMGLVMSISDKVVVLNFGRQIANGTPSEIQASKEVVSAYLGSEDV
jgi:branched-chain amino acid transport system ATP-binding protein